MMHKDRILLYAALVCGLGVTTTSGLRAQQASPPPTAQAVGQDSGQGQEVDPLKRQLSDKERFAAKKALRQELKGAYKTWLNQDVTYIISDEERRAFRNLSNDEERDAFIENFWLRRNPNPDSPENEFREEHYRRIAYANEHFGAGKPGWKTDRGHIYISFGKPDDIESHAGGMYNKTPEEGGGQTATYPFERWHYRYIEGIGENITMEFVDDCQCNDFHYSLDPQAKDALRTTPGMGATTREQMNPDTDNAEAGKFGYNLQNRGGGASDRQGAENFQRLEQYAKLFAPPPVKFKDLENFISEHKIMNGPVFPFDVRTDFAKVTESMDLVPITIQMKNRDITFVTKDGVSKGEVNILGKVSTLTHKTVQTFEETVEVEQPEELLQKSLDRQSIYWKALPLVPGLYRLDIAIKDVNNPDHIGIYGRGIEVPTYHDEKLGTSTLILADQMNEVSSREIGAGNFVIGNTFIRPRVSANMLTPVSFRRGQDLSFWMQVYNLGVDEATKSNQATVVYQIVDQASGMVVLEKQLDSKELGSHSDQLTVQKTLAIAGLQPGKYKVTIKVNDTISKQEIAQSAPFVVE
jgi:GWxTD domain-containing protein